MRLFTIVLVFSVNICYGQKTIDKTFSVSISQTDSIHIPTPYKDKVNRDSIVNRYSNWHQRARALEKYLLNLENPGITRNDNGLLEIKLLNGETIQLKPTPNSEETDFTFENYHKQLNLLLFRVQWGEGNNYLIVDFTNGKKTYIIGRPFFSPNKKLMIAINCDIEAQYSDNGFELFEFVNREFKKIWRYDPTIWGPVDLKWVDNTTITSRNYTMETSNGKITNTYTKIKVNRTSNAQANQMLARIADKDGFTNVRAGRGLSFDIVDKVTTEDFFYCETATVGDWCKVTLFRWHAGHQTIGYIHKSRVQVIEELDDVEQTRIILNVLKRKKILADKFIETNKKYNKALRKWNSAIDSISYRKTAGDLEAYSEAAYSPILQLLPNVFCGTRDRSITSNFIATLWSDRGSADEQPSYTIGECFACDSQGLSDQIRQLENKEQKELIINDIEWGLLNKFSVDENKESTDPKFLELKRQLDLLRN